MYFVNFIYNFILSVYFVSGIVLEAETLSVNKIDQVPDLMELIFICGQQIIIEINR